MVTVAERVLFHPEQPNLRWEVAATRITPLRAPKTGAALGNSMGYAGGGALSSSTRCYQRTRRIEEKKSS